ncbi:MAG: DUF433 domain-containing protein [Armatimonadetes bacterium]|nr:DUF433 domain-containing protein [Armatimonadota bacterium]PIY37257.1 MAG: hypothetical protein COZ05_22760 [Armatimonadetes bacterium CG_4_10_14_3_um_filter_59_10]
MHYVVKASWICDGRPTFRYTRIEVSHVLSLLSAGWTIPQIVEDYTRYG